MSQSAASAVKSVLDSIREKIARWGDGPVHVAMDGALFDDLPDMLRRADFESRPLFIEQSDPKMRRDGPHAVVFPRERLDDFLILPDVTKGGVFWNVPNCDAMTFYRHLRGLNMARLPTPATVELSSGRKTRMVVFRHFDPASVLVTLPVMTPAQRARMFGPAHALLLDTQSRQGTLEARRRNNWPDAEKGPLTFSRAQMDQVSDAMVARSRHNVMEFLRREAPGSTSDASDDVLLFFVKETERLARHWGLTTEKGFKAFAWIRLRSNGEAFEMNDVKAFVTDGQAVPDEQAHAIMQEVMRRDRKGAKR